MILNQDEQNLNANYERYSLQKSYDRVNRYFTVIVFITAIVGASTDTFTYLKHQFQFLFLINLTLTSFLLVDLVLMVSGRFSLKTAFSLLLYVTLFNITLTHIHEFRYDNFLAKTILIGFWGILFVVLSGMVLGKWHPYFVMLWADGLLVFDVIRSKSDFLLEIIPIIIVTLAGLSYGIIMYMRLLRNSFQKNQDILQELSVQNNCIEKQSKELEAKNKNLKELQQLQKDLIEMLVHDMKNPLNSILINSSEKDSGSGYKYIHEAGRQMLVLVENMLDVHKMEISRLNFQIESLNIKTVIVEALNQVEFLLNQSGSKIIVDISEKLFVRADKEILLRVFVNLFSNAIKHSPSDTQIGISSETKKNHSITISIKDNGEGLPIELKEKVFEKFEQVISRKSGLARSTGLGLAFCRMSIEFMEGKIWIADTSSEGTTISFTLPESEEINQKSLSFVQKGVPINLNHDDVDKLLPVVRKLELLDMYKAGLILNELANIDEDSLQIEMWVENIKSAIYSVNRKKYQHLLNMIKAT